MTISLYDAEGRIIQITSCPRSMISIQEIPEGGGYIEGAWDGRFYWVEGGAAKPRLAMNPQWGSVPIAADGIDTARLTNLPDPCTVIYEGPGFRHEGEVTGGVAEFTTDAVGAHTVTVSAWPFLDWKGGFDAI